MDTHSTPSVIPNHNDSNGWWETLPPAPAAHTPRGRSRVRTAVIGGGICGVSVTQRLAELCPSDDICLIEAERVGYGASGRNAGFMLDMHSHGEPKKLDVLRRNMQLWDYGLNSLRHKVREWQIQCDWSEAGRHYGAAGSDGAKHLNNIALTLDALDMPYRMQTRDDLHQQIGTGFYQSGLHAPQSALVNPAALMRGLAQHLPHNVTTYELSPVLSIESRNKQHVIRTAEAEITADRLILAAGVFLKQFGVAPVNYIPMATYASTTAPLTDEQLTAFGNAAEFGLLGASAHGSTIRLTRDHRLMIRNHFHFEPGHLPSKQRVDEISAMHKRAMIARWPAMKGVEFEHSWGGLMAFTRNNGTVFGEVSPNLYAILTNDVSPMTRGEAAGKLLAEHIEGIDSDLLSLQLSIPGASQIPPRPFLDMGIALKRGYMNLVAGKEF